MEFTKEQKTQLNKIAQENGYCDWDTMVANTEREKEEGRNAITKCRYIVRIYEGRPTHWRINWGRTCLEPNKSGQVTVEATRIDETRQHLGTTFTLPDLVFNHHIRFGKYTDPQGITIKFE